MIPVSRIRRALCHPDASVVSAVDSHLLRARSPAPLRVTDLIARLGTDSRCDAFVAAVLPRLPVTKHTVAALRSMATRSVGSAQHALLEMNPSVIVQLSAEVELPDIRHVAAEAVRHSTREFWSLWRSFLAIADDEEKRWQNHQDLRLLRAAMARTHPRELGEHLRATLAAPERFSEEIRREAIGVLARHPDPDALEALIYAFELDDLAAGETASALGRLGTTEVVRRVASGFRDRVEVYLCLGPSVLSWCATAESERVLHELMLEEKDVGDRTALAHAVCAGFVTRAFPDVLALVVSDDYYPDVAELDQELLIAATATGWTHPELEAVAESARITKLATAFPMLVDPSYDEGYPFAGSN